MVLNVLKIMWKILVFIWKIFWKVIVPIALVVGIILFVKGCSAEEKRLEEQGLAKWEETRHIVEYQTPITAYTYKGYSNGVDFYLWYVDSTGEEQTYEIPEEQWLEYAEYVNHNTAELKVTSEVGIDPRHTYKQEDKDNVIEKNISVEVVMIETEETKTE